MYNVDGFEFESKEDAQKALKERFGIKYIRDNTDFNDIDMVKKLYTKLSEPGTFSTATGFAFLVELQQYLNSQIDIEKEDIKPIHIRKSTAQVESLKKQLDKYKKRLRLAIFFVCVLGIAVVAMFGITYISGHSIYITNYENEIIDKYEGWEQELIERENALKEREAN